MRPSGSDGEPSPPAARLGLTLRLGLVGGGKDGLALLDRLLSEPDLAVTVVADPDPEAPAVVRARERGLRVVPTPEAVFRQPVDVVIEATGRPEVLQALRAICPADVEVIRAASAGILWDLVERRRLEAARLRTLIGAIHGLGREFSLRPVLDRIVRDVVGLVGDAVAKLWLRSEGDAMTLAASADERPGAARGWEVFPPGPGLTRTVLTEQRPLAVEDVRADPRTGNRAWVERAGLVSYAGVPLRFGDEVLGVLALFTRTRHAFTPGELELLSSFAASAAVAIRHAQALEEATHNARAFESLAEITRSIIRSLEAGEVYRAVVGGAVGVLGADAATLSVFDEATRTLSIGADLGFRYLEGREVKRWRLGEGLVGWVAQQLEPVFSQAFAEDSRVRNKTWARAEGLQAFGAVPLRVARDRLAGVLTVFYRRAHTFTDDEVKVFTALGNQAAVAIENARLYADLRRALDAVQESQERQIQTERLRALGEMASGVAHQFNNMLAALLGRAQLLLGQATDPKLRQGLETIEKIALDGAQTVRRIQEFTRVRRRQAADRLQLDHLIADALEFTRARWEREAQAAGRVYRVESDLGPLPAVLGEASELREVLVNVLLNAFDAMPDGGHLRVSARARDARVEVRVTDSGSGMTEETRRRAFEPFFTTKGPKVSGLGLAVAYGILERHGGSLELETAPGRGTTVVIALPAAPAPPPSAGTPTAPVAGQPLRVLVVEDEDEVRNVLVEALTRWGHAVAAAADGVEGLRLATGSPFDLVLTDVSLPGQSGWVIAEAVRARPGAVPIVFVTGWGDQLDPARLAALGHAEVLSKPFRLAALAQLLDRLATPAPR